jgi:hypothetical protein
MSNLKQASVDLKKAQGVATSVKSQLLDVQNSYSQCNSKLSALQGTKTAETIQDLASKWKVDLGSYASVTDDAALAQCSPLYVKTFGGALPKTKENLMTSFPPSSGKIPYPSEDVASSKSVAPVDSKSTTASAAAAVGAPDTNIWDAILNVLK